MILLGMLTLGSEGQPRLLLSRQFSSFFSEMAVTSGCDDEDPWAAHGDLAYAFIRSFVYLDMVDLISYPTNCIANAACKLSIIKRQFLVWGNS